VITPEELKEIREYTEKATPGPWYSKPFEWLGKPRFNIHQRNNPMPSASSKNKRDAEFIARSRTDLPRLLDAYEALQAENSALYRAIEKYCGSIQINVIRLSVERDTAPPEQEV
jgi:hypothetical protein